MVDWSWRPTPALSGALLKRSSLSSSNPRFAVLARLEAASSTSERSRFPDPEDSSFLDSLSFGFDSDPLDLNPASPGCGGMNIVPCSVTALWRTIFGRDVHTTASPNCGRSVVGVNDDVNAVILFMMVDYRFGYGGHKLFFQSTEKRVFLIEVSAQTRKNFVA